MAKRTQRGKKSGMKPIRCNRPNWRKEILDNHKGEIKYSHRGKKVKGEYWEKL